MSCCVDIYITIELTIVFIFVVVLKSLQSSSLMFYIKLTCVPGQLLPRNSKCLCALSSSFALCWVWLICSSCSLHPARFPQCPTASRVRAAIMIPPLFRPRTPTTPEITIAVPRPTIPRRQTVSSRPCKWIRPCGAEQFEDIWRMFRQRAVPTAGAGLLQNNLITLVFIFVGVRRRRPSESRFRLSKLVTGGWTDEGIWAWGRERRADCLRMETTLPPLWVFSIL